MHKISRFVPQEFPVWGSSLKRKTFKRRLAKQKVKK